MQCLARLKIVNGQYTLTKGHKSHEKPLHLNGIKKEIKASQSFETAREIKNRIISK